MTRRHLVVVLIGSLGLLLLAHSAGATAQCPGRINALATEVDNSLTILLSPDYDCGCLSNRLVLPGGAANLRATHANVLAAFLAGIRVSILYDYDPATPCYNCGACLIHNVSVFQ
jgi:hypothetical protein